MSADTNIDALLPPKLPPELFRPIMSNFAVHADRHTLRNVALSSKPLARESQRVLFRTTTDSFWKQNSLQRHILYLKAIINAPARLGPLVHEYTQHKLAMDASGSPVSLSADIPDAVTLWHLTMAALPAMVNLKYLQFSTRNIPSESSFEVLRACTFKLISLSWTLPLNQTRIGNDAGRFLGAQTDLVHLDMFHFAKAIPASVCPGLISIRATYRMWADFCLEDRRCIRGLDLVKDLTSPVTPVVEDGISQDVQDDLVDCANQLRILSCSSYTKLQSGFGDMPLRNLVLLRLLTYTTRNLLQISGFDSMRVLVLHTFNRESLSEGVVSSHLTFIFHGNSNLCYVDVHTEHREVFQRYYRPKFDAMDQKASVNLFRGNQAKGLWWDCHLDEANYMLQVGDTELQDLNDFVLSNMSTLSV